MRYGSVSGVDKPVSRLVQGTAWFSAGDADRCLAVLDEVFAQGCNAIDTAHQYGEGACERIVGRWVNERGLREKVVIIGKGAHHNADRRRVTPFDITTDLHDSLARFKFDSIDLYLLHRDDPAVPVGPIVEVLNDHLQAGRIRAFGGSNWTHQRIQEANDYSRAHGLVPFAASSPHFSLAEQVNEPWLNCASISGPGRQAARDWYMQQWMPVFAWSSLAGGFLTGRFRRDNLDGFEAEVDRLAVHAYATEDNFRRLDRADGLASEKGVSVAQIALAYILNQPLDLFALVGHRSGDECRANLAAFDVTLTGEELAWLELGS